MARVRAAPSDFMKEYFYTSAIQCRLVMAEQSRRGCFEVKPFQTMWNKILYNIYNSVILWCSLFWRDRRDQSLNSGFPTSQTEPVSLYASCFGHHRALLFYKQETRDKAFPLSYQCHYFLPPLSSLHNRRLFSWARSTRPRVSRSARCLALGCKY